MPTCWFNTPLRIWVLDPRPKRIKICQPSPMHTSNDTSNDTLPDSPPPKRIQQCANPHPYTWSKNPYSWSYLGKYVIMNFNDVICTLQAHQSGISTANHRSVHEQWTLVEHFAVLWHKILIIDVLSDRFNSFDVSEKASKSILQRVKWVEHSVILFHETSYSGA